MPKLKCFGSEKTFSDSWRGLYKLLRDGNSQVSLTDCTNPRKQ